MGKILILDALAAGKGAKRSAIDVIGAGPRTIAGVLESHGVEYRVARIEEYLNKPHKFDGYTALLVSAMTMDLPSVKRASKRFRGIKVVGGPITSDPLVVPRAGFDLGVWGEGERALDELVKRGFLEGLSEDVSNLENVITRDGSLSKTRHLTKEEYNRYKPSSVAVTFYRNPSYKIARIYVEVVRSCSNFNRPKIRAKESMCLICNACYELDLRKRLICPQGIPPGCGYCSIPSVYGPPKSRNLTILLEEVESLISLGVKRLVLSGADFLEYERESLVKGPLTHPSNPRPNLEAIEELLSSIFSLDAVSNGEVSIEVENVKPCLVDKEVADLLGKYLADSTIHIGVETGDPHHAELIGRPCGPDKSLEAIKLLKEAGLRPYAYFIHSLPGQTKLVAERTMHAMKKAYELGAEKITVYRFSPLPGSAFHKERVVYDDNSRKIAKLAMTLNRRRKEEMVGKIVEVLVSPSLRGRGYYGYPLRGGPAIRIITKRKLRAGDKLRIRVVGVLSDRLLLGKLD